MTIDGAAAMCTCTYAKDGAVACVGGVVGGDVVEGAAGGEGQPALKAALVDELAVLVLKALADVNHLHAGLDPGHDVGARLAVALGCLPQIRKVRFHHVLSRPHLRARLALQIAVDTQRVRPRERAGGREVGYYIGQQQQQQQQLLLITNSSMYWETSPTGKSFAG